MSTLRWFGWCLLLTCVGIVALSWGLVALHGW